MKEEISESLGFLEFFNDYSRANIEIISRYMTLSTVNKGTVIFREGEPGSFMLFIVNGHVAIYKDSESGANHLLAQEGRGRSVGEMALVDHSPRSATCIAERTCDILLMTDQALARLVTDHPAVAFQFAMGLARLISRRLRQTSGELADFVIESYMDS